jgi:regulator of protease activity HflC (stomatin/prohibitin superfamily)
MKKILIAGLISAFTFSGCYLPTSIDSGEIGVIKSWGAVQPDIINDGLTFSLIPGEDLHIMRTANKQAVFSHVPVAEQNQVNDTIYNNSITVITKSEEGMGVTIPLDISCLYQLNPHNAVGIIKEYGTDGAWDDKLVIRNIRSTVQQIVGKVSLDVLNRDRTTYENLIKTSLNNVLAKNGISITSFNIQVIGVPEAINNAVLAKETAKQNAEKAKFQVLQANAEAEVEIAKAKGIAQANDILAGSLTDKLVSYKQLEISRIQADKWNGAMPTTVAGANMPMMLMAK